MLHFECDYLEGCTPEILEVLASTNMNQTHGYGQDVYCERAQKLIRKECGKEDVDVHFLVGGTQANFTVISSILKPYQGVLCADTAHINVHETGAIEHGGHKVLSMPSKKGKINVEQIREAVVNHRNDANFEHIVQPGMVYLSFPTELGTIYTKKELIDISDFCRKEKLPLYIDGARIGYGLMSNKCDLTLRDIARLVDVFYIGGTKQGMLFGEAVVITNETLKKDFRYYIKQNGGMLAKGRLLGLQFETMFKGGLYWDLAKKADNLAMYLHDELSNRGYSFFVDSYTNQQFPIVSNRVLSKISANIAFEYWQEVDAEHSAVRFCTSWAISKESVDILLQVMAEAEQS